MSESKYKKYIIEAKLPVQESSGALESKRDHSRLIYLDDKVIKGAFYVECVWVWPVVGVYPHDVELQAHKHDYDEVITFFGSNPEDPLDLCGEVELWLEDEKQILTKSCLIFVPKGMKHCPLRVIRVDKPIFHFSVGTGGIYKKLYDIC